MARAVAAFFRPLVEEIGIAADPVGESTQRDFRRFEEGLLLRIGLGEAPRLHAGKDSANSHAQEFGVAGAQVSLVGEELVFQGLRDLVRALVVRLPQNLGAVEPPHVAVHPVLANLRRNLSAEVARAVGALAGVDTVFADAQFHNYGHCARRFADRSGQAVVVAEVERHGAKVLGQGHGLAEHPGFVFRFLEDTGEDLGAVQADAERGIEDFLAQGGDLCARRAHGAGQGEVGTCCAGGCEGRARSEESTPRTALDKLHRSYSFKGAARTLCGSCR